jgi:hypothetical protein
MHALAEADAYEAPSPDDEVLDLTRLEADEPSKAGEVLATLAGKPFELVGHALSAVRRRLPD